MTIRYVLTHVKGLSIASIAHCTRCGRPYAAGSNEAVAKIVNAMRIPGYLREKPRHTHVCPQCKDELVGSFLARCGNQRHRIEQELQLVQPARAGGSP